MTRAELLGGLASRIDRICRDHPLRVAIDGVDASGKTTLANELVSPLEALGRRVIRASVDGFHHPAAVRARRGAESPEGYYRDSFDCARLVRALLEPLGPGGTLRYRDAIFDYRSDAPVDASPQSAPPNAVLLFDGVFLLRPELREHWDFSIFVRADFAVTVRRAEERDLGLFGTREAVRRRYERRYVPGQQLYLAEVEPERRASVIVDNDDPLDPRLARAD